MLARFPVKDIEIKDPPLEKIIESILKGEEIMPGTIRWLGHAFVEWTTADDKVILFDPWTKDDGNPAGSIHWMRPFCP